jgi:hypothetical protein
MQGTVLVDNPFPGEAQPLKRPPDKLCVDAMLGGGRADQIASKCAARAAAAQPDLFCAACHSIEPGAQSVLAGWSVPTGYRAHRYRDR